jgi:hypothetical protein
MKSQTQTQETTQNVAPLISQMAHALAARLGDAVSVDVLCRAAATVRAADAQRLYYEQRLAMLDHYVVALGERGALARQLRALCLLQYARLAQPGGQLEGAVSAAVALSLLHELPDVVSLDRLAPLEREVALALRDQAADLPTLCARLDLSLPRLIQAHSSAIHKLCNAS